MDIYKSATTTLPRYILWNIANKKKKGRKEKVGG